MKTKNKIVKTHEKKSKKTKLPVIIKRPPSSAKSVDIFGLKFGIPLRGEKAYITRRNHTLLITIFHKNNLVSSRPVLLEPEKIEDYILEFTKCFLSAKISFKVDSQIGKFEEISAPSEF